MIEGIVGSFFLAFILAGILQEDYFESGAKGYFKSYGVVFGGLTVICIFIGGLAELI